MIESTARSVSEHKYVRASLSAAAISTGTNIDSPRQRIVIASHTRETVFLRFTPRTVRQTGAASQTR